MRDMRVIWCFGQSPVLGPCLEIVVRMCNHVPFELYHIVLHRPLEEPLNPHASNFSSLPFRFGPSSFVPQSPKDTTEEFEEEHACRVGISGTMDGRS